jgi:hypothetical protein
VVVLLLLSAAHRHDPVSKVEGFLNPVTMVDVNVDIQHPSVRLQQLQDGQHNIVDVAKSTGFSFLGVVHATCRTRQGVSRRRWDRGRGVHWQGVVGAAGVLS